MIDQVITELYEMYLGHYGVVSIAPSQTAAGQSITVYAMDPHEARMHIPTLFKGFQIDVRSASPI